MTTGEQPPSGNQPPTPPAIPLEAEGTPPSEKERQQAQLAADITEVLHHPAFSAVTEMAVDPEENPLAPLTSYVQQMALGYKVSETARGSREPLINSEIMGWLDKRRLNMYIKSTHNFHAMVDGLANHFKVSRDDMAASLPNLPSGNVVLPLFQDYLVLSDQGFIDNEGVKESFHDAAMRLRLLNVVLLFSPQAHDPTYISQVYDKMYEVGGERQTVDEYEVSLYVQELSRDVSSGKRLQKLNQRFGNQSTALLHRATEQLLIGNAKASFLNMTPEQMYRARQAYRNALGAMIGSDLERLHEKATEIETALETLGAVKTPQIVEQIVEASHLDWEVLPPGELEQHAREIVAAAQDTERGSTPPTIDLARLRTLSNVRTMLGEDRCYFARGKLGVRRKVKADGIEQADQYLLLVWRDLDEHGNLRGESVVAESPIAGKHALYIYRHDVSGGNWQSAMALPKHMARDMGARRVKHVLPSGETDLVQTMTRKAMALLSCRPEEFSTLKFARPRGVQIPRAVLPEPPQDE